MQIEMMKIEEIKPYEKNPRYNDNAINAVANSIKEFGFNVPLVIDKNNVIICGHTRYKAAKLLGLKEVPVIKATDLNNAKAKAFRIADNKTAELSSWDFEKLKDELLTIDSSDMLNFGFVESELNIKEEIPEDITAEDWNEISDFNDKSGRMIVTYSTTLEEKWLKSKVKENGILKEYYKINQIIKKQEGQDE